MVCNTTAPEISIAGQEPMAITLLVPGCAKCLLGASTTVRSERFGFYRCAVRRVPPRRLRQRVRLRQGLQTKPRHRPRPAPPPSPQMKSRVTESPRPWLLPSRYRYTSPAAAGMSYRMAVTWAAWSRVQPTVTGRPCPAGRAGLAGRQPLLGGRQSGIVMLLKLSGAIANLPPTAELAGSSTVSWVKNH